MNEKPKRESKTNKGNVEMDEAPIVISGGSLSVRSKAFPVLKGIHQELTATRGTDTVKGIKINGWGFDLKDKYRWRLRILPQNVVVKSSDGKGKTVTVTALGASNEGFLFDGTDRDKNVYIYTGKDEFVTGHEFHVADTGTFVPGPDSFGHKDEIVIDYNDS